MCKLHAAAFAQCIHSIANLTKCGYKTSSNFTGGKTCFKIYVFGIIQQLRDYSTLVSLAILDNYDIKRVILQ